MFSRMWKNVSSSVFILTSLMSALESVVSTSHVEKSMALLLNSRNSPFTNVVNYGHPGEMFTKCQFDYQQVSLTILPCEGHTIVTCRISISRRGKAEEWALIQTLSQISWYKLTVMIKDDISLVSSWTKWMCLLCYSPMQHLCISLDWSLSCS